MRKTIEQFMRIEQAEGSPCAIRITLLADGSFRARMVFAQGMPTASGTGRTLADALAKLQNQLNGE